MNETQFRIMLREKLVDTGYCEVFQWRNFAGEKLIQSQQQNVSEGVSNSYTLKTTTQTASADKEQRVSLANDYREKPASLIQQIRQTAEELSIILEKHGFESHLKINKGLQESADNLAIDSLSVSSSGLGHSVNLLKQKLKSLIEQWEKERICKNCEEKFDDHIEGRRKDNNELVFACSKYIFRLPKYPKGREFKSDNHEEQSEINKIKESLK